MFTGLLLIEIPSGSSASFIYPNTPTNKRRTLGNDHLSPSLTKVMKHSRFEIMRRTVRNSFFQRRLLDIVAELCT